MRKSCDETVESLLRFAFERLPRPPEPVNSVPCLAENWFVEDAKPLAMNYLTDADLRRIWRVARMQRLGLHPGAGCPWLLLHQMSELFDAMFRKAYEISECQRTPPLPEPADSGRG